MNYSNPSELQTAIEGNKREGRRTSYGTYPEVLGVHPVGPGAGGAPGGVPGNPLLAGLPTPVSLHHTLNGNGHLPGAGTGVRTQPISASVNLVMGIALRAFSPHYSNTCPGVPSPL